MSSIIRKLALSQLPLFSIADITSDQLLIKLALQDDAYAFDPLHLSIPALNYKTYIKVEQYRCHAAALPQAIFHTDLLQERPF